MQQEAEDGDELLGVDRPPEIGREDARLSYGRLLELLGKLRQAVVEADADRPAYAVQLPFPKKDDPKQGKVKVTVPVVLPEALNGASARAYAGEILAATLYHPDQHPQKVRRVPGLLAASPRTLELVRQVNVEKDIFRKAFESISPRATVRKAQIGTVIRFISVLQTYRTIPVLTVPPAKVSFTWAAHTSKTQRISVPVLVRLLKEQQINPPMGADRERWEMEIGVELAALSELPPDETVVRRGQVSPHPRASVYLPGQSKPLITPTSLPVFYPDDGRELPPIQPLGVLDMRFRRAQRSDVQVEEHPLLPRMHIYRYKEPYRTKAAPARNPAVNEEEEES
jgi:hypothetical protein